MPSVQIRLAAAGVVGLVIIGGPTGAQTQPAPSFITQAPGQQRARALEPHILRERRVDLDPSLLGAPASAPAERLSLDLFSDVAYTAVLDRFTRSNQGVTWTGYLAGVPQSSAVFVTVDGALAGHVSSPLGEFVLARDGAGGYVIQQVAPDAFPQEDDAVIPPVELRDDEERAPPLPRAPVGDARSAVVDVLVAYTTPAAAAVGGAAQMAANIQVMVTLADTALRNAGTGGLQLAGTVEVAFAASSDSGETLRALRNPSDGILDDVHALRDQVRADVVTLVMGFSNNSCGRGYVLTSAVPSDEAWAFNVVDQDCMQSHTFAHEVGHNLGLHHDWYVTEAGGVHPSSKGYVSLPGRFRTIMAYYRQCNDSGVRCSRITAFSNPENPHGGFATGVPIGTNLSCTVGNLNNPPCDADAVRTLVETVPLAATYRLRNRLNGGQSLYAGAGIQADGAACRLVFQSDGNLVAYDPMGAAYWNAGTGGATGGLAVLQTDGNFVVYDAGGGAVWHTHTGGHPGAVLIMQDDCNVVLYAASGAALWYTGPPS